MKRYFPHYLRQILYEHRSSLSGVALILLLDAASTLAIPLIGAKFGSQLLDGYSQGLVNLAFVLALLVMLQALFRYYSGLKLANIAIAIQAHITTRLHAHMMALPVYSLHEHTRGDRLSLFSQDSPKVTQFVTQTLVSAPIQLLTLIIAIIMMMSIAWHITLVILSCLLIALLALRFLGARIQVHSHASSELEAENLAMVEEDLHQNEWMHAQGLSTAAHERYSQSIEKLVAHKYQLQRWMTAFSPLLNFGLATAVVLTSLLISQSSESQNWTQEQVLQLMLFGLIMLRPLHGMATIYSSLRGIHGPNQRLEAFFTQSTSSYSTRNTELKLIESIAVHDVSFAYQAEHVVLQHCSLDIPANQVTALLGGNGHGKTTLARMLSGTVIPTSGQITIDGTPLSELSLQALREQIGYVPQHVQLSHASIRDNICLYRKGISENHLITICKQSLAHEFIMRLPDGYDTVIGDHGLKLSGGQAQRIALARALIHNPKLLILDEPTAMFDTQSEQDLVKHLRPAFKDRTVVLITHRPATLALAQHQYRLDSGQAHKVLS